MGNDSQGSTKIFHAIGFKAIKFNSIGFNEIEFDIINLVLVRLSANVGVFIMSANNNQFRFNQN